MSNKILYFYNFLLSLFPKGRLWNFGKNMRSLIKILAELLYELKDYIDKFRIESNPNTAVDTIKEWMQQYGIASTGDDESDEKLVRLYATATGGANVSYILNLLKGRYPNLTIEFNERYSVLLLKGMASTQAELNQIKGFLERVKPAWVFLLYNIDVIEDYGQYGICGIARAGASTCSYIVKDDTLYKDGKYGVCGVAQSGVAQFGREVPVLQKEKGGNK